MTRPARVAAVTVSMPSWTRSRETVFCRHQRSVQASFLEQLEQQTITSERCDIICHDPWSLVAKFV